MFIYIFCWYYFLIKIAKQSSFSEDLGQGINTDEAAALGAVYQAAFLSKGFRVKKFVIKDAILYPIQVSTVIVTVCVYNGVIINCKVVV